MPHPAPAENDRREHAYDAWTVNALILWRAFRRKRDSAGRAQRAHGTALPHVAAGATVLRYGMP